MSDKKRDILLIRAFALWAAVTFGVVAFLAIGAASAEVIYARLYDHQMFPGVRILDVRLDGLTPEEARQTVQKAIDQALAQGLRFSFQGKEVQLDVIGLATNPDTSHDLIRYDIDAALQVAYEVGRGDGWLKNVLEQFEARVRPTRIPASIAIDEAGIENALHELFKEKLVAAQDASFSIKTTTVGEPSVMIESEHAGTAFQMIDAFKAIHFQAEGLSYEPIELKKTTIEPQVYAADLQPLMAQIREFLGRPQLVFTYQDQTYPISTSTLASWIRAKDEHGQLKPALDPEAFHDTLRQLAPSLEQEVKKGSLVVTNGKIASFVPGIQGTAINATSTLRQVATRWPSEHVFPLIVDTVNGDLTGEDPDRLGIKEIIGVGRSNFAGSPVNRRKNIAKGIEKVNGTIIGDGEEFSLIKTLGPIDGEHGWFPELVIKGDKTLPEFGGGLCQIGTTSFRGALDTGLKITERQNHAYRVVYYEPAGTDATIYDPKPDMRFLNDTGHSILINAYTKGDTVIFEFWGTKDGRTVDPSWRTPKIFNITDPPPPKLVETTDLPPGKKKCTETAHKGADAEFTQIVTYADGSKMEHLFKSHYRPWGAVCMIGVAPGNSASSTSVVPVSPDVTASSSSLN